MSVLSSLEAAIYGGRQVPPAFLEKMAAMAPRAGTGQGLTETAGFCTYTDPGATVAEIAQSIGRDMPVYPMSIRGPMRPDGSAGDELPGGETGHVCFRGLQTFLGYVNDPEATARGLQRRLPLHRRHGFLRRARPAFRGACEMGHQARRQPGLPRRSGEPSLRAG